MADVPCRTGAAGGGPRDSEVLITGAGPAGLVLAGELALAGVPVTVLERDPGPPPYCRGFNLNARSLELFGLRGLAERFLAEGPVTPWTSFVGGARLDLGAMRTRHPYVLGIPQTRVEELLAEHATALGARVLRGHRVTSARQDADGVTVGTVTAGGPAGTWRCRWLVGCDGGRSTVRALAGIAFPGTAASRFTLLGDVTLADPEALPFGVTAGPGGTVFAVPRPGYVRLITGDPAPPADRDEPVTPRRFQEVLDAALGRPVRIAGVRWLTRFGNAARLAERLRQGRVLLAGDAAHIHPPAGAVGVNAAVDDAMNLGWRLALVAAGRAPDTLLEHYHEERHAAGARLLRDTRAQAVLAGPAEELGPVRDLLAHLASAPETAGPLAETVTAVGTRYPVARPRGHPWEGRTVPPVATVADGLPGPQRSLAAGRGVLLLAPGPRAAPLREAAAGWRDRVTPAGAEPGELPGAAAVLVRPDGHAACVVPPGGDPVAAAADLRAALAACFGPPVRRGGRAGRAARGPAVPGAGGAAAGP